MESNSYELYDGITYIVHGLKNGLKFYVRDKDNESFNNFWNWCIDYGKHDRNYYLTGDTVKKEVKKGNIILI